jgi:hypothetical protein
MKKAGRRPSTISTASWRRELSDPQPFPCARYPGDVAASTEISGQGLARRPRLEAT